jgi:hypothetical protein
MSADATLATDNRVRTRRRREARCEGTIELPYNEPHVDVECPACGEPFACTMAVPTTQSPTFGTCPAIDCGALLKYRSDGTGGTEATDEPTQTGLAAFGGGAR